MEILIISSHEVLKNISISPLGVKNFCSKLPEKMHGDSLQYASPGNGTKQGSPIKNINFSPTSNLRFSMKKDKLCKEDEDLVAENNSDDTCHLISNILNIRKLNDQQLQVYIF